jgi:hypothetical protein
MNEKQNKKDRERLALPGRIGIVLVVDNLDLDF